MQELNSIPGLEKAALRGEPSYVWRKGQQRRFEMVLDIAEDRVKGNVLENGCGVGMYIEKLQQQGGKVFGLEFDCERAKETGRKFDNVLNGAGENLPYPENYFDLILSHEVIEHVADDVKAVKEMVRVLKPEGRIALFCPNRGYPFETHGIIWRGKYRFGNKLFVNYLPGKMRNKLAPHVRVYSKRDLEKLFENLNVRIVKKQILFGAYDNIISRKPGLGKMLRAILQFLEKTPLRIFGLSHFWVIEKK